MVKKEQNQQCGLHLTEHYYCPLQVNILVQQDLGCPGLLYLSSQVVFVKSKFCVHLPGIDIIGLLQQLRKVFCVILIFSFVWTYQFGCCSWTDIVECCWTRLHFLIPPCFRIQTGAAARYPSLPLFPPLVQEKAWCCGHSARLTSTGVSPTLWIILLGLN